VDLMQLGSDLIKEQLGADGQERDTAGALSALSGGGGLDIGSIVTGMMANGDLSSVVTSWLGDGSNDAIGGNQLQAIFQNENIQAFAAKLGIDLDSATALLSNVLPNLVDKSSSGGSLLDSIDMEDVMGFAKKLF
jgi:uncharacterized protein YidB (DUF937 family)